MYYISANLISRKLTIFIKDCGGVSKDNNALICMPAV